MKKTTREREAHLIMITRVTHQEAKITVNLHSPGNGITKFTKSKTLAAEQKK